MKIIENSNIVNWDNYPEYVCAIVGFTTNDLEVNTGHISPAGEELIWLLDKPPLFLDGEISIKRTKIKCLAGFHITGKNLDCLDFKELHFKPKPIIQIKQSNHKACEA